MRRPAVAGSFYPRKADELRGMIKSMVHPEMKKEKAVAVVSPHAGFLYSGPVAGTVFSSVELPEIIVILGPAHHATRHSFAVMKEGEWQTPLGEIPLESGLAELIMERCGLVKDDPSAHAQEHSLEVQLPFIQYLKEEFSLVPICISYQAGYPELEDLGKSIASAIRDVRKDALIVASTDLSHYVSQQEAEKKDFLAIRKILEMDPRGLYDTVQENDISMCGYQPVIAALVASTALGAKKAELMQYQTSGDRTGNYLDVVGYAGLRIY